MKRKVGEEEEEKEEGRRRINTEEDGEVKW